MTKALLASILLVILTLAACSNPSPTAVVSPTETQLPEATAPSVSQPDPTKPANPTQEPTMVGTQRPTEIPTTAPESTSTTAPAPTLIPEPTATATAVATPTATTAPAPTSSPTTAPTPTHMPTVTLRPAATASPTASPTRTLTLIPRATQSPTATLTPASTQPPAKPSNLWRGIIIAPENRCSPYDSDEYRYSPSVEPRIVEAQGGIYGPYTGTWFESIKETDIEHIVARSEAHDSGLCAAGPATWSEFASDLLNLTLASPGVNRHQKSDNDIAEWLPDLNQCWYVDRTVQVRREYGLTIDRAEADAVDRILAGCHSTDMVVLAPGASATTTPARALPSSPTPDPGVDALALWDDNGNGRITCAEARAHGIAPVRRGHPAYQYMRDGDGDGVVCE